VTGEGASAGLAAELGELALARGLVVAVAESLTGGLLAQQLARAAEAGEWFAGGVVAYRSATKFRALGVDPGPVVTARCARQMAEGVQRLTGADLVVALTGVGGPGEEEGKPAGTVFLCALAADGRRHAAEHLLPGGPAEVVRRSVEIALRELLELARASIGDAPLPSP